MKTTRGIRGGRALLLAGLSVLAMAASAADPGSAEAGTWTALQCGTGNWSHEGVENRGGALNGYLPMDECGSADRHLGVYSLGSSSNGALGQWRFTPPTGTYFSRVRASAYTKSIENTAMLLTRPRGGGPGVIFGSTDSGGFQAMDSGAVVAGEFAVRLGCNRAAGCAGSLEEGVRARDLLLSIVDDTPPTVPALSGGLTSGGWKRGTASLTAALSDAGGGVAFDWVMVNGELAESKTQCDPEMTGGYTIKLKPCPSTATHSTSMDTAAGNWQEGNNSVSVCTFEYGAGFDGPACKQIEIAVDNVAPGAVEGLLVNGAAETDWTAANDFDLSWSNPAQASTEAPLGTVHYRVREPGADYDSGPQTVPGSGAESLDDLAMPHPGRFEVSVWTEDEAGNVDQASARSVTVKFDDTVPGVARPENANGWLDRAQSGQVFEQRWYAPTSAETPPSGIQGYAVVVDQQPITDPCDIDGSGGIAAECGSDEITHPGIENNSVAIQNLPEGSSFVHIAAVSGSGIKSGRIGHTELKVDRTDPTSVLTGASGPGWANREVLLEVAASDSGSGMADTDEYPGDLPPRTVLEIDGIPVEEARDSVSRLVDSEGVHEIRYWARDLAGNENDGIGQNAPPGVATVKLDMTPPKVAFSNTQDPAAPNVFRASYADALSGAVRGEISMRKVGTDAWSRLRTQMSNGELVAAVDDSELEREAHYEFRASVTDAAGNVTTTSKREDGSQVVVKAPFKAETAIERLRIAGKQRKARLGYSQKPTVSGRMVDGNGRPIVGAPVVISESYVAGSRQGRPTPLRATTGPGGSFRLDLPKGPSRTITVGGVETPRLLAPAEARLRAVVNGKVKLAVAPKRVRAGNVLHFRGKVLHRGADLPKGGKRVEIQVRIGKRWDVVDSSFQTRKSGSFALDRRLGRFYTQPTLFVFRAVVLKESGWAYRAPTRSKKLRVTVMPR